jgi:hypothetical protein
MKEEASEWVSSMCEVGTGRRQEKEEQGPAGKAGKETVGRRAARSTGTGEVASPEVRKGA